MTPVGVEFGPFYINNFEPTHSKPETQTQNAFFQHLR